MAGESDTNPKRVGLKVGSPKPRQSLEDSRASLDYYNSPRTDIDVSARAVCTDKKYEMNEFTE